MAGRRKRAENAVLTAELLNKTTPYLIFTGTIHADPGCPLYEQLKSGAFEESTIEEYLEEETVFLKHLNLEHSYYFGLHPSNVVPVAGRFAEDKETLLAEIRRVKAGFTQKQLSSKPIRGEEGAVSLS